MRGKQTIIINGRAYDALTGMPMETAPAPVAKPAAAGAKVPVTAQTGSHPVTVRTVGRKLRRKPHRSTTLRRDIVKHPARDHGKTAAHKRRHLKVAKSAMISKFAPHSAASATQANRQPATAPVVRAAHAKSLARHQNTRPPKAMSSREIKERLIKQRLDAAPAPRAPLRHRKTSLRVSSVMAACLGLMILGGYLSYNNMPGLSVLVAAAQAGVNAQYPGYIPSGYRFNGPVLYDSGDVTLRFAANGGITSYKINQKKSSWDSRAVLDNYVASQTDSYQVNNAQGLTIYTYSGNAAWVNRGILYTISGNAPLKTDQVLKIAASL